MKIAGAAKGQCRLKELDVKTYFTALAVAILQKKIKVGWVAQHISICSFRKSVKT